MTALFTASGEDLAASRGFHACAEAMRFGAPSFAWLVCALRQNNSPFKAWPDQQANLDDAFANPFGAMCGWKAKYWPQRRLDLNC
jgi:hypothetical protein